MKLRAKFMLLLLALGASAVILTSRMGYVYARRSAVERVMAQLTSVREAKRTELQNYFQNVLHETASLSEEELAADSIRGFREAIRFMHSSRTQAGLQAEVEQFYKSDYLPHLGKFMTLRSKPEEYLPHENAALLLQDLYILRNPHRDQKAELDDAGDGSRYSKVHARYHPMYRRLAERFGYADIYLIDHGSGQIVYSVQKKPDFGTSLVDGPYHKTELGAIYDKCRTAADPDATFIADFEPFEPSLGAPAGFACSPVFEHGRSIGALVVELSIDEIDRVLTGDKKWEKEGLGKTGESRAVGPDFLMRNDARGFITEPEEYLRLLGANGYSAASIAKIREFGTTVLQQEVRLPSIAAALRGEEGTMSQKGVFGEQTFISYGPLPAPGPHWSISTRIMESEALAPVMELRNRLLTMTVLILIALGLAASFASRSVVRPIQRLSDASRQIADGDLAVRVMGGSKDEIGTLGASFNRMADSIQQKTEEIRRKNQENESLLLNILPGSIADRIKGGEASIADNFAEVTVLFADIVDFTILSGGRPPAEVVELLNRLFSSFDGIAQRAGVEKIKTIGDAYMAVAGLPDPCEDHAERMVRVALGMMDEVRRFSADGLRLSLRIGINSGPVVAGVIGQSKFIYDLWGDTVNVASRMESHGLPGSIQVTRSVYERLKDRFEFEARGEIEVKGKGRMEAWILITAPERESAASCLTRLSESISVPMKPLDIVAIAAHPSDV